MGKTRNLKAAAERREAEQKRHATVMGIEGGALKVTRAELTMFVEARLQRFVGEELASMLLALLTEDAAFQSMLEGVVQRAVAAHYGAEAPQTPVGIIGLDGSALSSTAPHAGLVLPGQE